MGIPSYFNFILKNHPKIIVNKQQISCDFLFIDSNSLIYDSINELNFQIENNNQVYDLVYTKINELIQINSPQQLTYVCFDGVPPLPKMYQQRQRRFKSKLTKDILQTDTNKWNTNQITPGTDFMNQLDKYLENKFKTNEFVVVDGTKNNGEGEHKICHYIRNDVNRFLNKNSIIYGLDADLIMLGLILTCLDINVYLYKETKYFSYISQIKEDEKYYFNLKRLGLEIDNVLENCNITQSIYDYIMLCFLCGNDFLPHLPSINIRNNGIDYIIKFYKNLIRQQKRSKKTTIVKGLINIENKTINWSIFNILCKMFKSEENNKIKENIQWKQKFKYKLKPLNVEDKLNFLPCFDTEKEDYLIDTLDNYNEYILNYDNIDELCMQYLKTLEWTWKYYVGYPMECNDIYFDHSHGPLFNDLVKNVPINDTESLISKNNVKKEDVNPICQLFFVLPHCDHETIIPSKKYKKVFKELYDEIPLLKNTNFDVDYFLCKYFWESHMILENIDIFEMNKIINLKI